MTLSTRRAFLRSASTTLALPFLPSLASGKTPSKAPKRLVCVGTQLGWYKPDFFADNTGARLIKPFDDAGLGDQFTTISGLDHKGPTGNGHALVYTLFTGQVLGSVSLDQLVAPKMGTETRYESLQLCAGEIRNNAAMSLNENGIPLPPIIRPSVMFSKIFGGKAADLERQQYLLESGRSILDDVSEDARILSEKVVVVIGINSMNISPVSARWNRSSPAVAIGSTSRFQLASRVSRFLRVSLWRSPCCYRTKI
ncbi:MAG: hypothetical protein ACI8UO_000918 [Verrucomicrobiales bacterium]|jgi:hypothetical protein